MSEIRTRFPPSPTGMLHIGGLRTALYNWLFARKNGGKFLLRIEDTDRTRLVESATQNILDNLKWAGLDYDNEPVVQSQRLELYQRAADELLAKKIAYRCFCSAERLDQLRQQQQARKLPTRYDGLCRDLKPADITAKLAANVPSVIRFALPQHGTIVFHDLIRNEVRFNLAALDDQILIKSDGFPTYHLASVVDDHDMGVTHVIRGEEWLSSTPKHILLYQAFKWEVPTFAHLPLLLNPDRSKLSKRTGDVAVDDYRDAGYLPDAILNFVLLLGWNPGTEQEFFTRDEMVGQFDLSHVNKSGAIFNREKLDWINGNYIRSLPVEQLTDYALPWLKLAKLYDDKTDIDYVRKVIALEQKRIKRLGELPELIEYFFRQPEVDPKILPWRGQAVADTARILHQLYELLNSIPESAYEPVGLESRVKAWIQQEALANGPVLWPLRVALTGKKASPGPFEVSSVLGKTRSLERISNALRVLAE